MKRKTLSERKEKRVSVKKVAERGASALKEKANVRNVTAGCRVNKVKYRMKK
jgi:hypothetical protein